MENTPYFHALHFSESEKKRSKKLFFRFQITDHLPHNRAAFFRH